MNPSRLGGIQQRVIGGWLLAALAPLVGAGWALAAEPIVRVGIVVDGPWEGNARVRELTRREIQVLTEGEFDMRFPDEVYRIGDWTLETARTNLQSLLDNPQVDLVITWGLLASHAVCCYGDLPKPVIAPVIVDAALQGLPQENGASGLTNLNYVALPDTLAEELDTFRSVVPFRHVAILANRSLIEAIPELMQRTSMGLAGTGVSFEYISVGDSVDEALEAISARADAVYVWPLFQLSREEFSRLVAGLNARRLPSFSALGGDDLEAGLLASTGSEQFFPRLARRIALNTQRILLGEDAGSIPVQFSLRRQLTVNMATARAIGVSPSWEVLVEARLLHADEVDRFRTLSLSSVVGRAIAANLDLLAGQRAVASGRQEVIRSRSALLPQLDLSARALRIDRDRAAASFGSRAERTTTGSATLSQVIYSDTEFGDWAIQRRLQRGRELELETLRLDITLEAATTYLNLLRSKTLVQVQRNNLELTRSNLELARLRRSVGTAKQTEVLRWESRIASDRKALIEAVASQGVAEIAVNRLLHWPLEERFFTEEASVDDPNLTIGQERFTGYIETPRRFEILRGFAVQQGLARSPELQNLDTLIGALELGLRILRRAFWLPTLGLQASYEEILSEGGAGSEEFSISLDGVDFPLADDTSWSVGLNASLALFSGGGRRADRDQGGEELERLRLERTSLTEKLEQRIRSGMLIARAAYTGIGLSREAAEAASRNLELVADAYARGAVSILDLLDAQNAALNAEEQAANAGYDFLIDLMEVQRAVNRFDFFQTPESQNEWYERLEAYFAEAGIAPLERP